MYAGHRRKIRRKDKNKGVEEAKDQNLLLNVNLTYVRHDGSCANRESDDDDRIELRAEDDRHPVCFQARVMRGKVISKRARQVALSGE